jgi:hypothetical protein
MSDSSSDIRALPLSFLGEDCGERNRVGLGDTDRVGLGETEFDKTSFKERFGCVRRRVGERTRLLEA